MQELNGTFRRWVVDESWAVAIGSSLLGAAILPRNAAALTALLLASFWPALVLLLRRDVSFPGRLNAWALGLAAVPVAWVAVRSAFADNPRVAMLGAFGQHTGVVTWVVALAVAWVAALTYRRGDLGRLARALGLGGGVLGLFAVLDRLGVLSMLRFSVEPSGLMENSISLGQVLVVAACAGLAWLVGTRSTTQRVAAGGAMAFIAAGLLVADSAGAWVALGVAALLGTGALLLAKRSPRWPLILAATFALSIAVLTGALVWSLSNGVSAGLEQTIASASNNRAAIWTSAVTQLEHSPVVGRGAEQFSAWVEWGVDPGPALRQTGTTDPHNLALWWLLAGGGVAGIAVLVAAITVGQRLFAFVASSPRPPVASLAAAPFALVAAASFAWTSPLALMWSAVIVGVCLGANAGERRSVGEKGENDPHAGLSRAIGVAASALGVVIALAILAFGAHFEFTWARAVDTGRPASDSLVRAALVTRDPSIASIAVTQLLGQAGGGQEAVNETRSLLPVLVDASDWHVEAALARLRVASLGSDRSAAWNDIVNGIEDGKKADPASGLWDTLGAFQASAWDRDADAEAYADKALAETLPESARIALQSLSR